MSLLDPDQDRIGESPRSEVADEFQIRRRADSPDLGQAVNQSAEMRSALVFSQQRNHSVNAHLRASTERVQAVDQGTEMRSVVGFLRNSTVTLLILRVGHEGPRGSKHFKTVSR